MKFRILFIVYVLFFISCSQSDKTFSSFNSEFSFDNALKLFENKKYLKAKSEFEFLMFDNPGSQDATLSQFYYAECLFHLNDYYESIKEYEKYISISTNSRLITISKFLICKCYFELSQDYDKDQTETKIAINKCQSFIEEYAFLKGEEIEIHNKIVDLILFSESLIKDLRSKLAKKNFESGKLYIRIEEYDAALKYFNLVLTEYYDSPYVDDALYNIVLTNLLNGNRVDAENFFNLYHEDFIDDQKRLESEQLFNNRKFK